MGATVLLDVGLCWALVPRWGAAGAALATSASFTLVAVGYAWVLRRRQVRIFEGWPITADGDLVENRGGDCGVALQ